jgi:hypothetical protein
MPDRAHRDLPVQLRIGFTAPTRPITVHLQLSWLQILADPIDGTDDDVFHHLTAAGIVATADPLGGFTFPAAMLPRLANLPTHVTVDTDELLAPLFQLARYPSHDNLPATLSLEAGDHLLLSWFDGEHAYDEAFLPDAAPALLSCQLPFVATNEAWSMLKGSARLPVIAGKARVNLDGFIEIFTPTSPQLVEGAPLPGLFRLDETHFGLPLEYAAAIDDNPGFLWEGPRPVLERGPGRLPRLAVDLSEHAQRDLRHMVDELAAYRAQAVVWDSGLGRRMFVLAAIACLDAWPALIVAPPHAVWLWQRQLDQLRRTYSLTSADADVQIITYRDLAGRQRLPSPQAIVFDELGSPDASAPDAREALHRLDGILDAYRISCSGTWPVKVDDQVAWMSVLRPGEFRSDIPVAQRYPINSAQRAGEHVQAYLSRRTGAGAGGPDRFRRSSVLTVAPSDDLARTIATVLHRGDTDRRAVLAQIMEMISAGAPQSISPKLSEAAREVREAAIRGNRVAVVTRHRKTATMLKAMLRPVKSVTVTPGDVVPDGVPVMIVVFDTILPDLRSFDEVVLVDYPWSTGAVEDAVGSAAGRAGPQRVVFLHMPGTVDDRLAMLAAVRRESGDPFAASRELSPSDVAYLLSPRWVDPDEMV